MTSQDIARTATLLTVFAASACAEMFPDRSAHGIARLTMRNLGVVVGVVGTDDRCGFEAPDVVDNPTVKGTVGEVGSVSWRVDRCNLDFGDILIELPADCNGAFYSVSGGFTVTAEKTITGRITGDPTTPVIPDGPHAATIEILESSFDNFYVASNVSGNAMTIIEGSLSAVATPKLATAASNGVCSVKTRIITFEDVRYEESVIEVESPALTFGANIAGSNLHAQNGPDGLQENYLSGTIDVFGGSREVVTDGEGLDPDYDAVMHAASFACADDLAWPLTFECDMSSALAGGAARLSVQTFATLAKLASADKTCGFDSAGASIDIKGTAGGSGSVSNRIDGCVLEFPQPTVVDTDCNGVDTIVQGRAVVSGTKAVDGLLTGDNAAPVVPISRTAATLSINADLANFSVSTSSSDQYLEASGQLSGALIPTLAKDLDAGACSIPTPVAELSGIRWSNADALIVSGTLSLGMHISSSDLYAVNGRVGTTMNHIGGVLVADGQEVVISDESLNPDFDADVFDAAYQCDDNMEIPASDAECDITESLAQGAARLIVKTFGMLVKATDSNSSCGFSSVENTLPSGLNANLGDTVTAGWDVVDCAIGGAAPIHVSSDCSGQDTYIEGNARVSATKQVTGELVLGDPPILPRTRTSARIDVHSAVLTNFTVLDYQAGSAEPEAYIVVHSATLTGTSLPVTGEAADNPGAYIVPIPVAGFAGVEIRDADVTLHTEGKQFTLHIGVSNLDAFTGTFNGQSNQLDGNIEVGGGRTLGVPVNEHEMALNPDFDQAEFDNSYACLENLAGVVAE